MKINHLFSHKGVALVINEFINSEPKFGIICDILAIGNYALFYINMCESVFFEHLNSYEVTDNGVSCIIEKQKLQNCYPLPVRKWGNSLFVI